MVGETLKLNGSYEDSKLYGKLRNKVFMNMILIAALTSSCDEGGIPCAGTTTFKRSSGSCFYLYKVNNCWLNVWMGGSRMNFEG